MTNTPPMTVKRLPEPRDKASRKLFLREIKGFVDNSHRPRLIVDLSAIEQISPESIDLLLECVGHVEHGDGEVSVAGASPQTSVILEITQAATVLNMFPSVLEARTVGKSMLSSFGSRTTKAIAQPSSRHTAARVAIQKEAREL